MAMSGLVPRERVQKGGGFSEIAAWSLALSARSGLGFGLAAGACSAVQANNTGAG